MKIGILFASVNTSPVFTVDWHMNYDQLKQALNAIKVERMKIKPAAIQYRILQKTPLWWCVPQCSVSDIYVASSLPMGDILHD